MSPHLRLVDVSSELQTPEEISGPDAFGPPRRGGGPSAMAVRNSTGFVGTSTGLLILDFSKGGFPTEVARVQHEPPMGFRQSLAASDEWAVWSHGPGRNEEGDVLDGLTVYDVRDRQTPRLVGTIRVPGRTDHITDVAIVGPLVFLAAGFSGLLIYDISDPSLPRLLSNYDPGSWSRGVAVAGDVVFLTVSSNQGASWFHTLDVSDPGNPRLLDSRRTPGIAQGLAVSEPYLYLAVREAGLRVFDISRPEKSKMVKRYRTPEHVFDVEASDSVVAIWNETKGWVRILRREE